MKSRTAVVVLLALAVGATQAAGAILGCRVTGGGTVDACGPGDSGCDPLTPGSCAPTACASPALEATHGGQVGAPVGVPTAFAPDSACIAGEWTHVRHIRPRLFGNFHARSFDSLMCACLPCPENPDVDPVVGAICDRQDRICGPEPRSAPANKICFSGPGDYALTSGMRATRSVVFRVDVEDRSEPGGTNGRPPPDRYRMRIWFVDPDTADGLRLRQAVACGDGATESVAAPAPDVDDGGDLIRGNEQIHPPLNTPCPGASTSTTIPQTTTSTTSTTRATTTSTSTTSSTTTSTSTTTHSTTSSTTSSTTTTTTTTTTTSTTTTSTSTTTHSTTSSTTSSTTTSTTSSSTTTTSTSTTTQPTTSTTTTTTTTSTTATTTSSTTTSTSTTTQPTTSTTTTTTTTSTTATTTSSTTTSTSTSTQSTTTTTTSSTTTSTTTTTTSSTTTSSTTSSTTTTTTTTTIPGPG